MLSCSLEKPLMRRWHGEWEPLVLLLEELSLQGFVKDTWCHLCSHGILSEKAPLLWTLASSPHCEAVGIVGLFGWWDDFFIEINHILTYSFVHLFCKHLPNADSVSSTGLRPRQTMNAQQVCTPCYDLRTWNSQNRRWRWHCWCFPYFHCSKSPQVPKGIAVKSRAEPSVPTATHVYDFLIIHFSPKGEFETWWCSSISSWPQICQSPAPASPLLGLQVCISMSVGILQTCQQMLTKAYRTAQDRVTRKYYSFAEISGCSIPDSVLFQQKRRGLGRWLSGSEQLLLLQRIQIQSSPLPLTQREINKNKFLKCSDILCLTQAFLSLLVSLKACKIYFLLGNAFKVTKKLDEIGL